MIRPALKLLFPLTVTLLATLLLASCATAPTLHQQSAEDLRLNAESFISDNQLNEAAANLAAAVELAPQNADHALRYGEILEALALWKKAQASYQKALIQLPPEHPLRNTLIYRLTLLALFKFDDPAAADELREQLTVGTPAYHDIQGVITVRAGSPRKALAHFNRGLAAKPNKELAARILQHATVAYVQLDLSEKAFGTLFNAINLAKRKPALTNDIETDWKNLKNKYREN